MVTRCAIDSRTTAITTTSATPTLSCRALPPQVAGDPYLHRTAATGRRTDEGPGGDRTAFMVKDRESQVCCGPANGLEGEEADEGRQWGVVQTPPGEETGGQAQTLETCQDSLRKKY